MILSACNGAEETESSDNSNSESDVENVSASSKYPEFLTVAGATSGGTYFLLANALSQMMASEFPDIDTNAKSTAGSPVIIENIENGEVELGIAQAGVAEQAYNGIAQFEGQTMENIRQLTYFYPNVMQMVVRKDAEIESVEDFFGKTIAVGASGSATELNSRDLVKAAGLTYDNITPEYVSESQSVELMRNKQADGANMIAALGSSNMLDILSTGDYEILEIDEETIKTLSEEVNGAYYPYTIPADTYPNQPDPIETYAVANWLHGSAELSEDFVYEMMTSIYENKEVLVETHNVAENINLEDALNGQTIPLHDGAIKFYEENGIKVNQ
ncbi:TAXI family TRAP transporter solute-binding subunit [Alteribacillus sp. JSM 102045]|uniref:TAXI family TRAP transporter solute-binding subunit n=1 Tax=Alteribacillus sp. JSM 102045 TaxID=1562101 RepID=UPI0035BF40C8